MHIALDTNCVIPSRVGGLEAYTVTLAGLLARRGGWVERLLILARPENQVVFAPLASERCEVVVAPRPEGVLWSQGEGGQEGDALKVHQEAKQRILDAAEVDLVHAPGNTINPIDLEQPVVLNLHDLQHRHLPENFTAAEVAHRERWWGASARRAEAIVASTGFVAEDIRRELGVPAERIFVAHPPVEAFFLQAPARLAIERVREQLKLQAITFVYPAANWPHKNHARLIRAFFAANIPGAQLLLTGIHQRSGPLSELCGESGRVRLLGHVGREVLRCLYAASTALILPSLYEASSLPVMEAMACRCPVAASSIPGVAALVGEAGILFDPRDEAAMSDAMVRLAGDERLRLELAQRGRERIGAFTPERYLSDLRRAYEHALRMRHAQVA